VPPSGCPDEWLTPAPKCVAEVRLDVLLPIYQDGTPDARCSNCSLPDPSQVNPVRPAPHAVWYSGYPRSRVPPHAPKLNLDALLQPGPSAASQRCYWL